ncbi:MAG: DUF72 domain-containing protein [Candidatus Latescibacteria bacterium]|jgi:uncharacterized protein YecE (DUF72 family)|nr:DUF72 domain-containing protein [Candidatus Latescibacterota bacterium]
MVTVGTSGFVYKDWKGVFYPEKIKAGELLSYYKDYFRTVEINTTYYGIPKPSTFGRMIEATPEDFEFMVKANKATTHEMNDEEVAETFKDSIAPLKDAGRLSGILAQFPWRFRNVEKNRSYLSELAERYGDEKLFTEFRHNSWNRDEVFDFLSRLGIGFVFVDEPQIGKMMPPVARATSDTAYIRFHGRNAKTWWGKSGDRYNYNYSSEELDKWIEKIDVLEKTVWKIYAFFNNCHKGYAVRNAMMFMDLVKKKRK